MMQNRSRRFALAFLGLALEAFQPARTHAATPCVISLASPVSTEETKRPNLSDTGLIGSINGVKRSIIVDPKSNNQRWPSHDMYTVESDRRIVPYNADLWPVWSYLDKDSQATEPWSSRVIAWRYNQGLLISNPDRSAFEKISDDSIWGVYPLSHRHESLAVEASGSVFSIDGTKLAPWRPSYNGVPLKLPTIVSFGDMPALSAISMLDRDGYLHVLSDQNELTDLSYVGRGEFGPTLDIPGSKVALYLGQKIVVAIIKDTSSGKFQAKTLIATKNNEARNNFFVSRLFNQAFYFGRKHWYDFNNPEWLRLKSLELDDFGGDVGEREFSPQDLPTLNRTLFRGSKGWFLYDGHGMRAITNLGMTNPLDQVLDLPTIGRVLVISKQIASSGGRTFLASVITRQILPNGQAEDLPAQLARPANWIDWPEAGGALMTSDGTVFFVHPDLSYEQLRIPNDKQLTSSPKLSHEPATGGILLSGLDRLYLVVRSHISSDQNCVH